MENTQRFSNRVKDYRSHRPGYPPEILTFLREEGALPADGVVADIGSGTGLLTALFLDHAAAVYAVEPNDNMRDQAETDFAGRANFISVAAAAEATTLPTASIDLITAGQAFHWFERDKTRAEFLRILKPGGYVALVWNYRDVAADNFQRDYEELLAAHIANYKQLDHKTMTDEIIQNFYGSFNVKKFTAPNAQVFDLESLKGRLLSSSYVPKPPYPIAERLLVQVEKLFGSYQQNGGVRFIYKTQLYLGQLH